MLRHLIEQRQCFDDLCCFSAVAQQLSDHHCWWTLFPLCRPHHCPRRKRTECRWRLPTSFATFCDFIVRLACASTFHYLSKLRSQRHMIALQAVVGVTQGSMLRSEGGMTLFEQPDLMDQVSVLCGERNDQRP